MNQVTQAIADIWQSGRKIKKTPSGWLSGNAVCCHHRGEKQDRRGRGGMMLAADGCVFRCFNCNFTTGYKIGNPLGIKFKKLLSWMGADDNLINELMISSLREAEIGSSIIKIQYAAPECELPIGSVLLEDVIDEFPNHVEYIKERGLSIDTYPWYVSKQFEDRVIIPFTKYNKIVGYTSRGIRPAMSPKYKMELACPYVFGAELQKYEWEWTILSEGPFDALSLDGLAALHNTISDEQANIINNLGKKIITVPHFDKAGLADESLLQDAIDNDWYVSFPDWASDKVKDINQAYCLYGPLATTQMIFKNATNNPAKIMLQKKFYISNNK